MKQLAAKLSIAVFACLSVAACSEGVPPLVSQAVASPVESDAGYLPALFPMLEGASAEHVEAF